MDSKTLGIAAKINNRPNSSSRSSSLNRFGEKNQSQRQSSTRLEPLEQLELLERIIDFRETIAHYRRA